MANTSATGGYLVQASGPIYGDALDDFFHNVIQGLTELDENLIRPLFQLNPPPIPEPDIDWIAFGINITEAEKGTAHIQMAEDGLSGEMKRQERLEIPFQIYGINNFDIANKIRDGLQLGQNREVLYHNNISFKGFETPLTKLTEDVNGRYYKRCDFTLSFMREVNRVYPILSFEAVQFEIKKES
jgi:hypothetical protein